MSLLINRPDLVGNPAYFDVGGVVERESERCVAFISRDHSGATLAANVTADGLNLFVQRDSRVESVIHIRGDMLLNFVSWALRSHLKVSLHAQSESLDALEKRLGIKL